MKKQLKLTPVLNSLPRKYVNLPVEMLYFQNVLEFRLWIPISVVLSVVVLEKYV